MKVFHKPIYERILTHFLFCAVLLYFFGFNCRLRPVAFPAVYKEYVAGGFAIITIYLNFLVLFPKLYTCRRYKEYWLYTIGSVVLSSCLEMILVYPQLYNIYISYSRPEMIETLTMDSFYVTIRNGGLTLFAYTINEIIWLKKQTAEKDSLVREKYNSLDVKDKKHQPLFILTGNIYYCEQDRNISVIHLLDGKQYVRYCSMNSLEELLGKTEFVRISRNVIVPKNYISNFKDNKIELEKNDNYSQSMVFRVSESYLEKVVNQLNMEIKSPPIQNSKKNINDPDSKKISAVTDIQSILEVFNQNQKLLTVYHYISTHSNCKISDISDDCKISKGSVSRYLAKLTEHGLISYVGAKKTGGYTITQQKPLTEE